MSSMWECPCCKTRNLDYWALELENESCFFPRTCGTCWAEWLEWYMLEYDCQELTEEWHLPTNQNEPWMETKC